MKKLLFTTAILSLVVADFIPKKSQAQNAEIANKFSITANVGYVYNFAHDWGGGDVSGKANSGFGYGGRLGWTSKTGFGLSADYLGLASKWKNDQFDITNNHHVVTLTPSYRISFGENQEWGLKLGMGVGIRLADVAWGGNNANSISLGGSRVAGGAFYHGRSSSFICGESAYSDSIGKHYLDSNQCRNFNTGATENYNSFSDAEIADFFIKDTGVAKSDDFIIESTTPESAVSYGVWRRIFSNGIMPTTGSAFYRYSRNAGNDFNNFETRAQYIARLGIGAVSGWADSATTAEIAAACITDRGIGSTIVKGVCTTAAEAEVARLAAKAAADEAARLAAKAAADEAARLAADADAARLAAEVAEALRLAEISIATEAAVAACRATGGTYTNGVCTAVTAGKSAGHSAADEASSGKAKHDAGFVLAPELAIEYDNGLFHVDINARYIHELFNVKYVGIIGAADQLQKAGSLAVFVGAGIGLNF